MHRLAPFIFIGIMIVLFAVGIIILSYLLIFGALVGVVLFLIAWIKDKLTQKTHYPEVKKPRKGQTIDHQ
ncbi:MAG TPA: hypothetical protein VHM20_03925 [Gammaproteobacteria bacterium]|jgi:hypothetical protein|nr:hypothetical protein [Gammaproteobacteria bacterium]